MKDKGNKLLIIFCISVLVLALVSVVAVVGVIYWPSDKTTPPSVSEQGNKDSKDNQEDVVRKIASATVVNTGDVLMHNPVLDGAYVSSTGEYDFSPLFTAASPYFKAADLAVINLEGTLGGNEGRKYSGYPNFNLPDSMIDAMTASGVGMVITANNHCYDTGYSGLTRTARVLKEKGVDFIGTKETETDPTYIIKDVNGIKIGMAAFTYETPSSNGLKAINGISVKSEAGVLINSFAYERIDEFYLEAEQIINNMKSSGADCTVFYMHWGNEYKLKQNTWQETIAQKLCNLGVDVIVGGHPHVVEPIDMLYAEGGEHKTICIYSIGNAISNQRREYDYPSLPDGHTEDGMLFYYTFDKYSDGTTVLAGVDIIPTWVDKYRGTNGYLYTMYPLENMDDGAGKYGMTGQTATKAQNSYIHTKDIVAEGLTKCQTILGCNIRFAEN